MYRLNTLTRRRETQRDQEKWATFFPLFFHLTNRFFLCIVHSHLVKTLISFFDCALSQLWISWPKLKSVKGFNRGGKTQSSANCRLSVFIFYPTKGHRTKFSSFNPKRISFHFLSIFLSHHLSSSSSFFHFSKQTMSNLKDQEPEYHNVLIIGAGVTGLALACQLKMMTGETDFRILCVLLPLSIF